MRLLVLGDEEFLGHHAAAAALGQGHEVTVLPDSGETTLEGARVVTGPDDGGPWDVVLVVGGSPARLPAAPLVGWLTGSAGDPPDGVGFVARVTNPVGPRDPSDRFSYWPLRLGRAAAGTHDGPVLLPGDPGRAVSFSDARDVVDWVVRMLADGLTGEFEVAGPGSPTTMQEVVEACLAAAGTAPDAVELVWVDEDFLDGVLPAEHRPLWFDRSTGTPAVPAGLTFRPPEQTARDTMSWSWDHAIADGLDSGLSAEQETELIAAWRAR